VKAEIPIESVAQATRQLLRLGAEAEVLAPAALREAIASEAARITKLYRARR
jgi:predicted DNA-binding transcriptional regulator YafY